MKRPNQTSKQFLLFLPSALLSCVNFVWTGYLKIENQVFIAKTFISSYCICIGLPYYCVVCSLPPYMKNMLHYNFIEANALVSQNPALAVSKSCFK